MLNSKKSRTKRSTSQYKRRTRSRKHQRSKRSVKEYKKLARKYINDMLYKYDGVAFQNLQAYRDRFSAPVIVQKYVIPSSDSEIKRLYKEAYVHFRSMFRNPELGIKYLLEKYRYDENINVIRNMHLPKERESEVIIGYIGHKEKTDFETGVAEADDYFKNYFLIEGDKSLRKEYDSLSSNPKILEIVNDANLESTYKDKVILIEKYKILKAVDESRLLKASLGIGDISFFKDIERLADKFHSALEYFQHKYQYSDYFTLQDYVNNLFVTNTYNTRIKDILNSSATEIMKQMLLTIELANIDQTPTIQGTNFRINKVLDALVEYPIYLNWYDNSYQQTKLNKKYNQAIEYFTKIFGSKFALEIGNLIEKHKDVLKDSKTSKKENLITLMEIYKKDDDFEVKYIKAVDYFKNKYPSNFGDKMRLLESRYPGISKAKGPKNIVIDLAEIDKKESYYLDPLYKDALSYFTKNKRSNVQAYVESQKVPELDTYEKTGYTITNSIYVYINPINPLESVLTETFLVENIGQDKDILNTIKTILVYERDLAKNKADLDAEKVRVKEVTEKRKSEADKPRVDFLNECNKKATDYFSKKYNVDESKKRQGELKNGYKIDLEFYKRNGISIGDYYYGDFNTFPDHWDKVSVYYIYCREVEEEIIEKDYRKAIAYFNRTYGESDDLIETLTIDQLKTRLGNQYDAVVLKLGGDIFKNKLAKQLEKEVNEVRKSYLALLKAGSIEAYGDKGKERIITLDNKYKNFIQRLDITYPVKVKDKYNIYRYYLYDLQLYKADDTWFGTVYNFLSNIRPYLSSWYDWIVNMFYYYIWNHVYHRLFRIGYITLPFNIPYFGNIIRWGWGYGLVPGEQLKLVTPDRNIPLEQLEQAKLMNEAVKMQTEQVKIINTNLGEEGPVRTGLLQLENSVKATNTELLAIKDSLGSENLQQCAQRILGSIADIQTGTSDSLRTIVSQMSQKQRETLGLLFDNFLKSNEKISSEFIRTGNLTRTTLFSAITELNKNVTYNVNEIKNTVQNLSRATTVVNPSFMAGSGLFNDFVSLNNSVVLSEDNPPTGQTSENTATTEDQSNLTHQNSFSSPGSPISKRTTPNESPQRNSEEKVENNPPGGGYPASARIFEGV